MSLTFIGDSLIVDDQIVGDAQLVVRIVAQQSRCHLLLGYVVALKQSKNIIKMFMEAMKMSMSGPAAVIS